MFTVGLFDPHDWCSDRKFPDHLVRSEREKEKGVNEERTFHLRTSPTLTTLDIDRTHQCEVIVVMVSS